MAKAEHITEVISWLYRESKEVIDAFMHTNRNDLIEYHLSTGMHIRNELELWKVKWTPKIIDGVDHSPEHPDKVSMEIIEGVWDELQGFRDDVLIAD